MRATLKIVSVLGAASLMGANAHAQQRPENPIPPSGGAIKFAAPDSDAAQSLPYSPIVEANGVLYLAGHLGRDPETGKLSGRIEDETRHALDAISKTLNSVNATLSDVVRCVVLLDDIDDYGDLNAVYRTYFPKNPPARTTVAVKDLPLGAKIEIECTAVRGERDG